MPTFQIGLEDGRSLNIEADSQEAALAGADHFIKQEAPSGVVAGARQGLANLMHGPAETAKQFFGADTSALEAKSKEVAPKNYKAAPIIPENGKWFDPTTYTWKNVPQNLAENAPAIAESIIAAKVAGRAHPLAGLAAGVGVFAANTLGDTAKRAAEVRTGKEDAEPTSQDKTRALATVALQSVPQAIGVSRFLPGAGKVSSVGTKGVIESGTKALTTTAIEGASGAAQNVIGQAGLTVGTDKGLTIDGNEVANAGVTNAMVGGTLTAPRAIANIKAAQKYKEFGGDNEAATAAFANRIATAADGDSLRNTKTGFEAVRDSHEAVRSELKAAAKGVTVDADTAAALSRAGKGRKLTDTDLSQIEANTTPDVALLARQAHVGAMLKEQGDFAGGKFTGGIANTVGKHIRAYQNPIGAAASAGLGAAFGGGHAASLFAYSPQTLAALAGAYATMRGLDAMTGNRSPANNFVSRFADPSQPTRTAAPAAPQPISAPGVGPTGPSIAPPAASPTPWGPTPPAPAPQPTIRATLNTNAALHTGLAKIAQQLSAAKRQSLITQSQPLLQQLAATRPAPAAAVAPEAPTAAPAPPSTAVDPKVLAQSRGLMTALARVQKIKDSTIGRQNADAIAQDSPLVAEAGGLEAISNPNVGKRASQLVSAAAALKRLRAQPEETADAPGLVPDSPDASAAPPPVIAKITKKNGKVEEAPQKEEGPAYTGEYVPLTDAELYGKGWNDQRFAEYESNKPHVKMKEQYAANVEFDRKKRRNVLAEILGDHETDGDIGARLLEELHHIRRGDKAAKAIKHYAAQMSPENRAAVLKRMDSSFINSMWSK